MDLRTKSAKFYNRRKIIPFCCLGLECYCFAVKCVLQKYEFFHAVCPKQGFNMSAHRRVKHASQINVTQERPSTHHLFQPCSHLKYLSPTLHPPHCHQSKKREKKNQDEVVVVVFSPFCDRRTLYHLPGLLYHPSLCCWYLFFNY